MRSYTCPNCNANLRIDDKNRDYAFCQYCGAQIILDDYRSTNTYRVVNEAKIKQAEVRETIRLKELELEEKEREDKKKFLKLKIKISIILAIVSLLMIVIGWFLGSISDDPESPFYMLTLCGLFPGIAIPWIWIISSEINKK